MLKAPRKELITYTPEDCKVIEELALNCQEYDIFAGTWFPRYFYRPSAPFHKEMHDLADIHPFLAFQAPRGHAKTTNFTFLRVMKSIAYRLNYFILIISDTWNQGVLFLDSIRNEIKVNSEFTHTYGVTLETDKVDELVIRIANGDGTYHEMMIRAMGAGQKFRGLKFRSKRPDLVLLDDVENDELVRSDERRDKLKRWFWGTLIPSLAEIDPVKHIQLYSEFDLEEEHQVLQDILENDQIPEEKKADLHNMLINMDFGDFDPEEYSYPQMIFVGTILHDDSLLANVLRSKKFHSVFYQIIKDDGTPLWPERHSLESIMDMKAEYEEQNILDVFYQEYFGVCQDQEKKPFQLYWFPKFKLEEINNRIQLARWYRVVTVDLAQRDKIDTDYNCLMASAYDPTTDNIYMLDYLRFKASFHDLMEAFFMFVQKYQIHRALIESNQGQYYFFDEALREARIRRIFCDIKEVNHGADTNKIIRILAGQPYARMGKVHLQHWMIEFEKELQAFPKGANDDVLDAWAMILEAIRDVIPDRHKAGIINRGMNPEGILQRGAHAKTGY